MIVYGVFYNPCIHESAAALLSLHLNESKAKEYMNEQIEEQLAQIKRGNDWCIEHNMSDCVQIVEIKDYERYFVQQLEVFE